MANISENNSNKRIDSEVVEFLGEFWLNYNHLAIYCDLKQQAAFETTRRNNSSKFIRELCLARSIKAPNFDGVDILLDKILADANIKHKALLEKFVISDSDPKWKISSIGNTPRFNPKFEKTVGVKYESKNNIYTIKTEFYADTRSLINRKYLIKHEPQKNILKISEIEEHDPELNEIRDILKDGPIRKPCYFKGRLYDSKPLRSFLDEQKKIVLMDNPKIYDFLFKSSTGATSDK